VWVRRSPRLGQCSAGSLAVATPKQADRASDVVNEAPRRGAYGLRISGLPQADALLVQADEGWSRLDIQRVLGHARADGVIGRDLASIALEGSGSLTIDRDAARATVTSPRPPGDREMVHPYLGAIAAVVSHWLGRRSFHSGGVVVGGGAWGILGDRESGKSTLLAWFAAQGIGVLSDDLLVVRSGTALAGPRCVDLRRDAADALAVGEPIGVVGARERWRLPLAQVAAEVPLTGWIVLGWHDQVTLRRVAPARRLPILVENLAIAAEPADALGLVALTALPMLEFLRPRQLGEIARTSELLLAGLPKAVR
jgi:hypothetical protein